MSGILKEWVTRLPIRQQAVLLAAIRGCDGAPKDDPSKAVLWALRWDILHPDTPGIDPRKTRSFMGIRADLHSSLVKFLDSLDQYPFHFVMHLTHAIEILGYKLPDEADRAFWRDIYLKICIQNLHCNPETREQMDMRLSDHSHKHLMVDPTGGEPDGQ